MGKCNKMQKGGELPDEWFKNTRGNVSDHVVNGTEPTVSQYVKKDRYMKEHICIFFQKLYDDSLKGYVDLPALEGGILETMLSNIEKENKDEGKYRSQTWHKITTGTKTLIEEKRTEIKNHICNIFKTGEDTDPLRGIDAIKKLKEMYPGIEKTHPLAHNHKKGITVQAYVGGESDGVKYEGFDHNYQTWFELYEKCKGKGVKGDCKYASSPEVEDPTAVADASTPAAVEGGKRRTRKGKKAKKRGTKKAKKTAKRKSKKSRR
jgi:hypothetical protein